MAGPTPHPFIKAFSLATVTTLVVITALHENYGAPGFEFIWRVVLATAVPAGITGYLAHRSPKLWPFWKIAAVYLAIFLALIFLMAFPYIQYTSRVSRI